MVDVNGDAPKRMVRLLFWQNARGKKEQILPLLTWE
jgi:hypothetical protein